LKLEVIGEPDMSADSLTITPEGSIRLPIAGPLKVANLTLPEAVNSIRSLLARDYLVDPNVRLWRTATVEPSPQLPTENTKDIWPGAPSAPSITPPPDTAARPDTCHFTISDQVAKPGRYEWPGNQNMTILRAIGMAGGTKASANLGKVVIRRNSNGKTKDTPCDLRKIAWVPENEIPLLQNGDEIIVPRE
jgi:protein involved in polysaccharide export with SLBB domain